MGVRFAAIGLDHRHIYDLTAHLLAAGMECAGYWPETTDARVLAGFRKRYPDIPEVAEKERLLDDPAIRVIVTAAVPRDRAALAMEAMRRGKDVMADKPGVASMHQLEDIRHAVTETGRIFSVCFSERLMSPSSEMALRLVREGAIGRVIQTVGLGPHRLNRAIRPDWFWEKDACGGILNDIGSHQIDQFIAFTGSEHTEIAMAQLGSYAVGQGFDDFGEVLLRSERASGYFRVDWFTPDGMPSWGDGRTVVLGTEGTIELRKNMDIEGRAGSEHLFLADNKGTRYIYCEGGTPGYFSAFAADVANRTETAMTQAHVFEVCRLALQAQSHAQRVPAEQVL
jgi:predicted dehydrogenase